MLLGDLTAGSYRETDAMQAGDYTETRKMLVLK